MKYYIIEDLCACGGHNNVMLVKANNKKDALNKMWIALGYDNQEDAIENGYTPHCKKDFKVGSIDDYFEIMSDNDVAVIW